MLSHMLPIIIPRPALGDAQRLSNKSVPMADRWAQDLYSVYNMPVEDLNTRSSSINIPGSTFSKPSKPLYLQITEILKSRIVRGDWSEGDAIPTRRALAAELSTTHATIDKAINELIREGLVSATVGSGTYVSRQGVTSKSVISTRLDSINTSQRIGVLVRHLAFFIDPLSDPPKTAHYYVDILSGIRDSLFGRNIDVAYINIQDGAPYEQVSSRDLDGIIIIATRLAELNDLKSLAKKYKMIAVGISADESSDDLLLPAVDSDNRPAAYDAVMHLIKLGHTQIGLIDVAMDLANTYDRYRGYIDAISESRLSICPDHLLLYPNFGTADLETQILRWMRKQIDNDNLPTAIFASDLTMTTALISCMSKLNIRIPQDVSVVGFDDSPAFEYGSPAITVVRQPIYDLGRTAAQRLLESLKHKDAPFPVGTVKLACEFIERRSTAPPR
jgi:DNA-binding LacI/PurR family transcriptional regulator